MRKAKVKKQPTAAEIKAVRELYSEEAIKAWAKSGGLSKAAERLALEIGLSIYEEPDSVFIKDYKELSKGLGDVSLIKPLDK